MQRLLLALTYLLARDPGASALAMSVGASAPRHRLEQELGLVMVEWPQTPSRMTEASENLHRLIVEGKLTQPGDPDLDLHVAQATAKQTGRGWRLDKADRRAQIDAAVALSMCAQRASQPEPTAELIGWL